MRERFEGLTPSSGLLDDYGGTLPEYRFIDATNTLVQVVETLDVSAIDSGLLETHHRIATPILGNTPAGNATFRLETGTVSGSGTAFTRLTGDGVFSGVGVREVKIWDETNWIAVNYDAITNLSITNVTATYWTDGTPITARLLAEFTQAMQSTSGSSTASIPKYTATAGEALVIGPVYQADDDLIYQFDDPTDIDQCERVGYVIASASLGAEVTVYLAGLSVAKPSGVGTLPIGKPIIASPTGLVTWDGDTTDPLTASGSFQVFLGKSFDGSTIQLNTLNFLGVRV